MDYYSTVISLDDFNFFLGPEGPKPQARAPYGTNYSTIIYFLYMYYILIHFCFIQKQSDGI